MSRARAFASIDIALERSRAASRDREAGQTTLFGLFDAAPAAGATSAPTAGDYVECEPWDRRELLVRERQALGFYVSGHPLERYLKGAAGLGKLGAAAIAECAGMDDWAPIKIAGMVEGYRERIFKDGGGKVAFFDLEDLTGRVNVKLRARDIELYAPVLAAGEPVLVTGKVSFPQRGDDAEDEADGPREPTILVSEVHPLTVAVRAETRVDRDPRPGGAYARGRPHEPRPGAGRGQGHLPGHALRELRRRSRGRPQPRRGLEGRCG